MSKNLTRQCNLTPQTVTLYACRIKARQVATQLIAALCEGHMNIYPRKYTIEERDDGSIINFEWSVPGFSNLGIWCIAKYISLKTGAKKTNNIRSPFESQIVLSLDGIEISIYQEDQLGIDVMSLTKGTEAQFKKVIGLFNDSSFFKQQCT